MDEEYEAGWDDPFIPIPFPHEVMRKCGHTEMIYVSPPFDYVDELAGEVRCLACRGLPPLAPRQYYHGIHRVRTPLGPGLVATNLELGYQDSGKG